MLRLCPSNFSVHALKVLLEYEAFVDAVNEDGWTPLHLAAGKGHAKVAKVNLQSDFDRVLKCWFLDPPRTRSGCQPKERHRMGSSAFCGTLCRRRNGGGA